MLEFEPAFVQETLNWCNRHREAQHKTPLSRLPKGYQGDPETCPCGTATGLTVRTMFYEDPEAGTTLLLPKAVQEFVIAFDTGKLPQYIEEAEE